MGFSLLVVVAIYFIARNGYTAKLDLIERLGVVGVPNADFFKFIYPLFILSASFAFFITGMTPGVFWRWILFLVLVFFLASTIFLFEGLSLFPLALLFAVALAILIGESIYYFGITLKNKASSALLGFLFLWSIYAIYFVYATLLTVLRKENV